MSVQINFRASKEQREAWRSASNGNLSKWIKRVLDAAVLKSKRP